jgi:hypothetical protein
MTGYALDPGLFANVSVLLGICSSDELKRWYGEIIELPAFDGAVTIPAYTELLDIRRSERSYTKSPATQEQLAFMLWSTQGVQKISV